MDPLGVLFLVSVIILIAGIIVFLSAWKKDALRLGLLGIIIILAGGALVAWCLGVL